MKAFVRIDVTRYPRFLLRGCNIVITGKGNMAKAATSISAEL